MYTRISFNSLWLFVARVGAQAFAVLFVGIVARTLGLTGFGQFSLAAALVYLGNTVTTFGTDTLLIRETARQRPSPRLLGEVLWLQLTLSVAWIAGQWLVSSLLAVSQPLRAALLVYSLSLLPLAVYTVCSALLRGLQRMNLFSLLSLLSAAAQAAVAAWAMAVGGNLVALCVGLVLAQLAAACVAVWLCARTVPELSNNLPELVITDPRQLRPLIRSAWPLALLTGLAVLSQRLGVLVVSVLAGDVTTGLFSAAARLSDGLKLGHQSVLGSMMPALSRRNTDSARLFRLSLWSLPLAGGVLALGASLLAQPLLLLVYGQGFEAATSAFVILAWALVPYSLNATLSLSLVTAGAERTLARATLASTAVAAILFAVLVAQFGLLGAAWAAFGSECVQTGLLLVTYRTARQAALPEPSTHGA